MITFRTLNDIIFIKLNWNTKQKNKKKKNDGEF